MTCKTFFLPLCRTLFVCLVSLSACRQINKRLISCTDERNMSHTWTLLTSSSTPVLLVLVSFCWRIRVFTAFMPRKRRSGSLHLPNIWARAAGHTSSRCGLLRSLSDHIPPGPDHVSGGRSDVVSARCKWRSQSVEMLILKPHTVLQVQIYGGASTIKWFLAERGMVNGFTADFIASFAASQCGEIHPVFKIE